MRERVNDGLNQSMNGMKVCMIDCMNEWMHEQLNEWLHEFYNCINKWIIAKLNEWMNNSMKKWIIAIYKWKNE